MIDRSELHRVFPAASAEETEAVHEPDEAGSVTHVCDPYHPSV